MFKKKINVLIYVENVNESCRFLWKCVRRRRKRFKRSEIFGKISIFLKPKQSVGSTRIASIFSRPGIFLSKKKIKKKMSLITLYGSFELILQSESALLAKTNIFRAELAS